MRTTVRVDDALLARVRRYARRRGATFTTVFTEALQEKLARSAREATPTKQVPLPTFKGRGLRPGVDLHASAVLRDLMDRADP